MKKVFSILLACMATLLLSACSDQSEAPRLLDKAGVAPYKLTGSEEYLLQSLNLNDRALVLNFCAPQEAVSLNVNAYRLQEGGWESIGGGAVSLDTAQSSPEGLKGTFAMELKPEYGIDFHINAGGLASYSTEALPQDGDFLSSTKGFLREFQEIELGKEIPVALMVYDRGTTMESYTLEDYFEPSHFEGMDLVQIVTLTFE